MKQKTPLPEPNRAGPDPEEIKRSMTFQIPGVFGKSADKLPAGERKIINALRRFYAYRHNGYLLAEALEICTRNHVNPPTWVLVSVTEGFQRFNDGEATLEQALHMDKRDRQEYRQYREQQPLMYELYKAINRDPKKRIQPACIELAMRKRLNPETVEKQYRNMWRGFFDYVYGKQPAKNS